ncbi:hypothetical protein PRZ48_008205 [Zasmidium cellare]|uniref:BTB domain-containing protein n=1 Tax=Zasmidium cellare TaxID=395010 RepID=A0ABR0EET4_ZASCE|nr:hypothetical protein PRZ48_008205 [Zasmidium cellare]
MEPDTSEFYSDFVAQVAELRNDTKTADFTIACGPDVYKVHKLVLRLHSKFFARLFKNDFQEARENRITLADDFRRPVGGMIDYFYRFNYYFTRDFYCNNDSEEEAASRECEPRTGQDECMPSELHAHAYMYNLAEKYDIPGLKKLAKYKFATSADWLLYRASDGWHRYEDEKVFTRHAKEFLDVIPYVYKNSAPNDTTLRESIVKVWRGRATELKDVVKKEQWAELLEKCPEMGVDMIMGLGAEDEDCEKEVSK